MSAIIEKLEETDAALFDHRRRLVQSEKLSAVGELAAKLAHEVLNPLAGMKAAVQLLERQGAAAPRRRAGGGDGARARPEISRVEGLVRRLMSYARPLAPRVELATVGSLVDAAMRRPGRRWPGSACASSGARSPICRRWRSTRS